MFQPQNKIVIIDNRKDHLEKLQEPFAEKGIGCRTFVYDPFFNSALTGVRAAFFDINLYDISVENEQQIFATLSNAIKSYISFDNGPFALIFWTSNKPLVEKFKAYIKNRNEKLPRPFIVSCIDKDEFINTQNDLSAKLLEILNTDVINLLFDFETKAYHAASEAVNQIYSIIPSDDDWGSTESFNANFEQIFSKIAVSATGFEHAKANPDVAIYEALTPMLSYEVVKTSRNSTVWRKQLNTLSKVTSQAQIPKIVGFNESILNTIFHVDTSPNILPITRGAVVDYNFYPQSSNRFTYFKELDKQSRELFLKFVQFSDTATSLQREMIIADSRWVAIEISASCDFSQSKPRNHKYVLGLLTPNVQKELIDSMRISESVFYKDLPVLIYKEVECRLWINFNFSFSDFETNERLGCPLFLLKKEIMDLIGNRYANHVSRIGITSF